MKIALLIECDNPKNEIRWNKLVEMAPKIGVFFEKKVKERILSSVSNWTDNTNHLVVWIEFGITQNSAKFYDEEEFHQLATDYAKIADNVSIRALRPGISV
ncbi:MAG: hypothetical protein ACW97X_07815 [Candidatus Hodarchaeales archaeon]